jgi:hypothetical protein
MDEKILERYFQIVAKINAKLEVSDPDLKFYYETTPEISEDNIKKFLEDKKRASNDKNFNADPELAKAAFIDAGRIIQSSPVYKAQTLKLAEGTEAARITDKLATGINLVLAGSDVANSVAQIRASQSAGSKSRKPSRPAIHQRDQYLQNALRSAEESTFDAARAMAPVEAQIQDTYLADVQNAKTAATGQAGSFGAYRQLASNRRNRAALNLAPIQDDIKAREQSRYDNLLGMRMGETQQMFQNQASLYGQDLDQYNQEQKAIAGLGATGRMNLRDSLYNLGGQAASTIGESYAQKRYRNLTNQALASGINPKYVTEADKKLQGYYGAMGADDTPQYWEQIY